MSAIQQPTSLLQTPPFHFVGGITPAAHKPTGKLAYRHFALPPKLRLSLYQPNHAPLIPCVKVGDMVSSGEQLAYAHQAGSVPIFAPLAGRISAIGKEQPLSRQALSAPYIELIPHAQQTPTTHTPLLAHADALKQSQPEVLLQALELSGIRGLGGAGFPSHIKLRQANLHTLIINGVECEPYICCDDALMQNKAEQIIQGIQAMAHLLGVRRCYFAIEENKPFALAAIKTAIQSLPAYHLPSIELFVMPYRYPSGGEKQLIKALTNQEVPSGKPAASMGIICHNVGTVFAIYEYLYCGIPFSKRLVTLAGNGLEQSLNVWVHLGTPIEALLHFVQLSELESYQFTLGGPLTGFEPLNLQAGLLAHTQCLLINKVKKTPPKPPEQPCIRCGECVPVCPSKLLPQQLYWFAQAGEQHKAEHHNLFDCIECAACDYVCPSHIPLTHYYRQAKQEIRIKRLSTQKSQQAKLRHAQRETRLEHERLQREQKRQARRAETAHSHQHPAHTQTPTLATELEQALLEKKILAQIDRVQKSQKRLDMASKDNLNSVETLTRALHKQQQKLAQLQQMQTHTNKANT